MNNELIEKEKRAITLFKLMKPQDDKGFYGCYSGGKDSDAIYILSKLAGAEIEWHHNLTTVDAPETVNYVRSHKDIIIDKPEKTMWQLIVENGMPPTRLVRYCCEELKEHGGDGRFCVTGVRKDESLNRALNNAEITVFNKPKDTIKKADELGVEYEETQKGGVILNYDNDNTRRLTEQCYRTRKVTLNPIVDWTEEDVWDFLHHYGCESNPLYQCGLSRIGCIGCPMASKGRYAQFARYPKYKENYIRAFDRMINANKERGWKNNRKNNWKDGEECFRWWMGEDVNQVRFEDLDF